MNTIVEFITNHNEIIALTLSVIGAILALYQWSMTRKNNHAEYVDKLLQKMNDDVDIHAFLSEVDYDEEWYDDKFHNDNNHVVATKADKTFFFFNYLCYLKSIKLLSNKDMGVFEYYLITLASNENAKTYFLDLYQFSMRKNKKFPFEFYLDYCIQKGFFPKEIKSKDYYKQIMLLESEMNSHKEITVPESIMSIYRTFGRKTYIENCDRCSHCIHCNMEKQSCDKNHVCDEFRWCCFDKHCSDFTVM